MQQLVTVQELRLCAEELAQAAQRFSDVAEALEKEEVEGIHLHWRYTSLKHIPGITKAASEALVASEDAIRARKAGRKTRAEAEIEKAQKDKRTLERAKKVPKGRAK